MVQVLDPAEETLPYDGRAEFSGVEAGERWLADRVETLRASTRSGWPIIARRLEEITHRLGWSFLVHHTDRPAAEPLLTLDHAPRGSKCGADYRGPSTAEAVA